ncbi:MAG TPA: PLP-dependent lyase/thiolase [Candidatus Paceibacterota bacterium]
MLTPQEKCDQLGKTIGLNTESCLYLKREDIHPYGSHKGRSIPIMIDKYIKEGIKHFAISSSGNAALAALLFIKEINKKRKENDKIVLEIFAGKNINPKKLEKLENEKDEHTLLSLQDKPLQALFIKTQDENIKSLRQSNDDTALVGYKSLAEELEEVKNLSAIFIGTSSGTTAQALAQYFIDKNKKIEIHIVQTSSCHPIAKEFIDTDIEEEKSIADAIVDKVAIRKEKLVDLIRKTGGGGYVVSNEEIEIAQKITEKNTGLKISPNSALSLAGLMQAIYTGKKWPGQVVCVICGD